MVRLYRSQCFLQARLNEVWRDVSIEEKNSLKFYSDKASIEETPLGLKNAVISSTFMW